MNTQEKAAALNALSEISIKIRRPNDWYVSQSVEVKRGSILCGRYGNGVTPEAAIEDHWRVLVEELESGEYLVTKVYSEERRAYKWAGFMWEEVREEL